MIAWKDLTREQKDRRNYLRRRRRKLGISQEGDWRGRNKRKWDLAKSDPVKKEIYLARIRKWRHENRERCNTWAKKWRKANRASRRASEMKWYWKREYGVFKDAAIMLRTLKKEMRNGTKTNSR